MRDVTLNGISKIVAEAEKEGAVLLTRNNKPVSIVMPVTWSGYKKFLDRTEQIMKEGIKSGSYSDTDVEDMFEMMRLIRKNHSRLE